MSQHNQTNAGTATSQSIGGASPTHEQVYEFLSRRYKHDRFAGRDRGTPGYSHDVTKSTLEDLRGKGWSMISQHEHVAGYAFVFTSSLKELDEDTGRKVVRGELSPEAA